LAEPSPKFIAPIAIPMSVRMRQWRRRLLPSVSFVVCVGLAGWLWTRQSAVTHGWGEVYSPLVELNAPVAGELKAADQQAPRLYDFVEKGQQLASISSDGQVSLVIAPVTGHLTELHAQPGQIVPVGAKLFRITPDQGDYIVGYVTRRSDQTLRQKTPVTVRTKGREPINFATMIEEVGPTGAATKLKGHPAPNADSTIPVRVGIPQHVHLRPGQLVELQFPDATPAETGRAAEMAMGVGEDKNF
jgi:hypothetical protein